MNRYLLITSIVGGLTIILGAFGAHALEEILEPLITMSPMLARGKPVLRYVSLIADTKLEVSTVTKSALEPTLVSTLNSS